MFRYHIAGAGVDKTRLARQMQKTFGHALGSIAEDSAIDRAQYFLMFVGAFRQAQNMTSPPQLQKLMSRLRAPFNSMYLIEPDLLAEDEAVYEAMMIRWRETVADGEHMCTHDYMLQCFSTALQDEAVWPTDDKAVDQLAAVIRNQASGRYSELSGLTSSKLDSTNGAAKRKHEETPSYNARSESVLSLGSGGVSSLQGSVDLGLGSRKKAKLPLPPQPLDDEGKA